MNDLQIFENEQFGKIRTVMIDGEPWFVGNDVAAALGYEKARNALTKHVDKDDALKWGVIDKLGREQNMIVINESGLYSLIFSSQLESAKAFKRWVTHDVLPTLRKTGTYSTGQIATPSKPTMAIVREMELRFKAMEKMGCSPYEIAGMMTSMDRAYGIAVSKVFADQVDPQLCLFDVPAETPLLPV